MNTQAIFMRQLQVGFTSIIDHHCFSVQTTAHFERIPQAIISHIQQARYSVIVAVAWFTDASIFQTLCALSGRGVLVELMIANDEANFRETGLDFEQLRRVGGQVYTAGKNRSKTFMHNKFCVIDGQTVITGSFNWSQSARQNHENITVSTDAGPLAAQFLAEFTQLRDLYAPPGPSAPLDLGKVLKRLEIIKTLIALDEGEEIGLHLQKLNEQSLTNDISEIVRLLRQGQFAQAIRQIDEFGKLHSTLVRYVDPEIGALKIEIRILELQVKALEAERADVEKTLHDFSVQHTISLGDLIVRLLQLRREQARTLEEREEAEADYTQYHRDYTEIKQQPRYELTPDEQWELKKKYRKAAQLCHPDVVAEAFKAQAEHLFNELREASDRNDLTRVTEILEALEKGEPLPSRSESVTEKTLLYHEKARLQRIADAAREALEQLRNSETYKQIFQLPDWSAYFEETRVKLQTQLDAMLNAVPS